MLYIGMLFSMFEWHVEDHYLYSINFITVGHQKHGMEFPVVLLMSLRKLSRIMFTLEKYYQETGQKEPLRCLQKKNNYVFSKDPVGESRSGLQTCAITRGVRWHVS
ncbi:putative transcription factor & chromatin remodeling &Metalloenzymes JmjC family [Helianthus annuus]|uniref:Transcription factor & chromatin remodeling &Metalloenzymes JmjC family n=2 Tax=Helianthus annuus TaxID=4232 RepID=A0A9K3HAL1_HELAN|nr:putative transcription factor & chromatin remodeling &Metalloenzymes JmjC family [Helianthus annuus]